VRYDGLAALVRLGLFVENDGGASAEALRFPVGIRRTILEHG
jgi:hypothetical protein